MQGEVADATALATGYTFETFIVPAIANDGYYTNNGNGISIRTPFISGNFTVNASGKKVKFSKGNLQYDKTTEEYSFMEHQYSRVEYAGQNVGSMYADQNIVSLFGWGMWGEGKNPCETRTKTSYYSWAEFSGTNDGYDNWRTLTIMEWRYLLSQRTIDQSASGHFCAKAQVNEINGLILLPDDWADSYYTLTNYNPPANTAAPFDDNIIDDNGLAVLESHGCVFLPLAGSRSSANVGANMDEIGKYHSATKYKTDQTYSLAITATNINYTNSYSKMNIGAPVRLVRDVN